MLNRDYQPTTIDPNRLLIGIASVAVDGIDLGALTNASIEVTTETKERYVGYPANRTDIITDSITAIASLTAEEIGSAAVLNLLANLIRDLDSPVVTQYAVDMLAPFAGGGNLKMSADVKLIPELQVNFQDNWNSLTFKFECLGSNIQTLLRKSMEAGDRKPATTQNSTTLSVGKPRLEISGVTVGALQQASLVIQGSSKKVLAGYPKCTKDIIYVDSKVELRVALEETELTPITDCSVKLIQAIVDGGFISLEFAHCAILEDMSFMSQNDWTGRGYKIMPFKPGPTDVLIKLERG